MAQPDVCMYRDGSGRLQMFYVIERAVAGILSKDISGSVDVTLTPEEYANGLIALTGVLTGSINVILPVITGSQWEFDNTTTGGSFTVTAKTASGTGVLCAHGSPTLVTCDGVNINIAYPGSLMLRRFDGDDANPIDKTIHPLTDGFTCSNPVVELLSTWRIEGFYLLTTTRPYVSMARSGNRGNHWSTFTVLPQIYTAITASRSMGRWVILGYRASQWYVTVGELKSSEPTGYYTWSSEVSLGLSNPQGQGHVSVRADGTLEFVYLDEAGAWQIIRCRGIGKDGVGTWA